MSDQVLRAEQAFSAPGTRMSPLTPEQLSGWFKECADAVKRDLAEFGLEPIGKIQIESWTESEVVLSWAIRKKLGRAV